MSDSDDKKTTADGAAAPEAAKSPLELAQEEAGKWKNEFLYLKAEFENYKKHAIKERSELLKFGAERVARDILDVVDNFERALQVKLTPETMQSFKTGVELTHKELKEVLAKHGVSEIPSEGQAFNPAHHEAISSEPTAAIPAGHVARVFKKPYKLHEKVIRMGQVVVAAPPSNHSQEPN
ncbi:MAG: nucleotide exchange factor GrpE [Pseudobdellovibrio sp.]